MSTTEHPSCLQQRKIRYLTKRLILLASCPGLYERERTRHTLALFLFPTTTKHTLTQKSSCTALIDCGADVNRQDSSGLTALHVACYHGNKEATNVLLSKRAAVDIRDKMVCAHILINEDCSFLLGVLSSSINCMQGHSALHWSAVPANHNCLQLILRYD